MQDSSSWPNPTMQGEGDIRFSALLYSPDPWEDKRKRFYTFNGSDLDAGGLVNLSPLDAVFSDEGQTSSDFPMFPSHCNIGHSLFLVGGLPTYKEVRPTFFDVEVRPTYSNNLLSFNSAASPTSGGFATWNICGKMQHRRSEPMAVPNDGKIFIIGGTRSRDSWIEIYDPQSNKFVGSMDLPEDDPIIYPTSYFLWKDSKVRRHKKPLILLYCPMQGHYQLYSYDVEVNRMKLFDPYFPPPARTPIYATRILVPLGISDFLLIIDKPDFWSVYDLSTKKVTAEVLVQGLTHNGCVRHAFCRRSFDEGSVILYIFMDFYKDYDGGGGEDEYFYFEKEHSYYTDIPYARVKLRTDGFVAIVESRGTLRVGDYFEIYMFAEQTTKNSLEETPLEAGKDGKDGKEMKLGRMPSCPLM